METGNRTKIIVVTHKKYRMPQNSVYVPLYVGAAGKNITGYYRDDIGDNISLKNPYFCELTGLYWEWKNLDYDYLGVTHYRRYFTLKRLAGIRTCRSSVQEKMKYILNEKEIIQLEAKYDIIVPQKRRYIIETLYSHYAHSHYSLHLDLVRGVIAEKYADYLPAFDKVMKQRSGHMFNMFIMKKTLVEQYCTWLFDILFELEEQVDVDELSPFQGRLYGRVSEIIFNVWLLYQIERSHIKIKSIPCLFMEPVKFRKKTVAFLKAKFFHEKYESGF